MRRYNTIITNSAYDDLDKITDYLVAKSQSAAARIYTEIIDSYNRLKDFPLSGNCLDDDALIKEGYRKLVCGDYISVYRLVEDTVVIYHIFHGAQNYQAFFK